MVKLTFKNPFAMGNLNDLIIAREEDDIEYLKEWSREAVKKYEHTRSVQMEAIIYLIKLSADSERFVERLRKMLKEDHND